jgi:hypothetical protein
MASIRLRTMVPKGWARKDVRFYFRKLLVELAKVGVEWLMPLWSGWVARAYLGASWMETFLTIGLVLALQRTGETKEGVAKLVTWMEEADLELKKGPPSLSLRCRVCGSPSSAKIPPGTTIEGSDLHCITCGGELEANVMH